MQVTTLLIVDLEATCWKGNVEGLDRSQTVDDMEVIEFGCALCSTDGTIIDSRSLFVQPQQHRQLSEFCKRLTGIQQSDVEHAAFYPQVVKALNEWLQAFEISHWASWGNYDRRQLEAEQKRHNCAPDFCALPHINIKNLWRNQYAGDSNVGISDALEFHQLEFSGRLHRGIDDARNIARLVPFINLNQSEN